MPRRYAPPLPLERRRGPEGPLLLSVCAWLPRGGAYAKLGTSLAASATPRGMTRLALRVTPLNVPAVRLRIRAAPPAEVFVAYENAADVRRLSGSAPVEGNQRRISPGTYCHRRLTGAGWSSRTETRGRGDV